MGSKISKNMGDIVSLLLKVVEAQVEIEKFLKTANPALGVVGDDLRLLCDKNTEIVKRVFAEANVIDSVTYEKMKKILKGL